MAEDDEDSEIPINFRSAENGSDEEEDEYDLEQRRAVGSGVEMDIDAEYQEIEAESIPILDAPVDDVVVEEIEEKKIDEPQREGDYMTTCGSAGMLMVEPSQDVWPRELSLFVQRGMYELPLPEHAESLAIDTLLRMCSLDFEVEEPVNVDYMSPSGRAPFLKCGYFLVSELEPICRLLSRKGASLSGDLPEEAQRRQQELWSLAQSSLPAAEQLICWLHDGTRRALTKPLVAARYPWPLKVVIARQKRQRALAWLANREPGGASAGDLELSLDMVYKQVDDVCSTLSLELGEAPYFFGEKPTELEALLYGHFFLLLTVPIPVDETNTLSQVIRDYPNLVALVARMDSEVYGRDLNIFLS